MNATIFGSIYLYHYSYYFLKCVSLYLLITWELDTMTEMSKMCNLLLVLKIIFCKDIFEGYKCFFVVVVIIHISTGYLKLGRIRHLLLPIESLL